MSDRPTPETKWYVTEYPDECSFAITDGNEILVTIIGGNTIGDQCDLASRIAKLPDLERERDEANEELHKQLVRYDQLFDEAEKIRIERDEAREEVSSIRNMLSRNGEAVGNGEHNFSIIEMVENLLQSKDYFVRKSDSLKRERDEAREALKRIYQASIVAQSVEEDFAEWEKAMEMILDLIKKEAH